MQKSFCLAIEVESEEAGIGLGYLIAFTPPADTKDPETHPNYKVWSEAVKKAVLALGDQVLHTDNYTRKVEITSFMRALHTLNKKNDFQIGFIKGVPAVQIHSTNIYDDIFEIDFINKNGKFKTVVKNIKDLERVAAQHGQVRLTEITQKFFPFKRKKKSTPTAMPKP